MAEEVRYLVLPANHEPTEMMELTEKPFDSPTSGIAAPEGDHLEWTSGALREASDHLIAVALGKSTIQTVAVVGFVADQSRWEGVEEALPEDTSTSWLSCGGALSILTAKGRL
jgi:hypothetical protein